MKRRASTSDQKYPLAKPLINLTGVGEKTALALHKHEIITIFDLLLHAPKSVVEQIVAPGFLHMEHGRHYLLKGKVVGVKITGTHQKKRLEAILQDDTGRVSVVFFGPAVNYAQPYLKEGAEVRLSGEAKEFLGRMQMVHPKLYFADKTTEEHDVKTYAQIAGLNSASFKRIVVKALAEVKNLSSADHLHDSMLKTHKLSSLKDALIGIHELKKGDADWDQRGESPYFRRLAFEELLSFYLRLKLERRKDGKKNGRPVDMVDLSTLIKDFLPFELTQAQARVAEEIISDMAHKQPMTRLLQGDVGSGKTAVSAIASLHAARAGLQVAVMAPTEILAEQLFHVYRRLFENSGFKLAVLTASTKTKERKQIVADIRSKTINIVIGTHALLSDDVEFGDLGLIIIDEQHRFGVKQRSDLLNKTVDITGLSPHLLVMSATPIPRSLALTFYGDLDLSVIDEKPKGRVAIHTQIFLGPVLSTIERLCERIILTKQKAFIVFPLIEESEHLDLEHATKAAQFLEEKFGKASTMLLHGKMKPDEKALAMEEFKNGEVSFLVATTVIEVGVDVAKATCMLIVHPERFGLAQLHQLRGRVGRNDLKSFCFLVSDLTNKFGHAYRRLDALAKNDDGFKLAEIDLELRGPGELLGVKQSGLPNFIIFNHQDFADLLTPAKIYAEQLANGNLHDELNHLFMNKEARFS